MRANRLGMTLASATAVLAITAGTVTAASASVTASEPASKQVATAGTVVPLQVYNFGLSTSQATNVQCWLKEFWGYSDSLDGMLGPNSWKAFQRNLMEHWGYPGPIDGDPGPNTIMALQRLLKDGGHGYTGEIDGDAGPLTEAAFKNFASWAGQFC